MGLDLLAQVPFDFAAFRIVDFEQLPLLIVNPLQGDHFRFAFVVEDALRNGGLLRLPFLLPLELVDLWLHTVVAVICDEDVVRRGT